jgi:hypothetical protein
MSLAHSKKRDPRRFELRPAGAPKAARGSGVYGDAQNIERPSFCVGDGRKAWKWDPVFCTSCRRGAAIARRAEVAPSLPLDSYDHTASTWREACLLDSALIGRDPDAAVASAGRVSLDGLRDGELALDAESVADGDAVAPGATKSRFAVGARRTPRGHPRRPSGPALARDRVPGEPRSASSQATLARPVESVFGRPGKHGRFKVGNSSKFLREYATLFHSVGRLDRIPMSRFGQHIIVGKVRTVTMGGDQKRIPGAMQYSVITAGTDRVVSFG